MAKMRLLVLAAFAVAVTGLGAAENKVTLEGTLVSSGCYLGNPNHPTGNDMGGKKGCGTDCLRKGEPAGLVTKEGQFHILVVSSLKLAPYVGQEVRITGTDHDGVIAVEKAEVTKNGKWEEINLKFKEATATKSN